MLCLNISDIAKIAIKRVDYGCIIHDISKSEEIQLLENSVLGDYINEINIENRVYKYYFAFLIKAER